MNVAFAKLAEVGALLLIGFLFGHWLGTLQSHVALSQCRQRFSAYETQVSQTNADALAKAAQASQANAIAYHASEVASSNSHQQIDTYFTGLRHDATNIQKPSRATCSLVPDGLRVWNAANAAAGRAP